MKAEELKYVQNYFNGVFDEIQKAKLAMVAFNYGNAMTILGKAMPILKIAPDPIFEVGDIIRHKNVNDTYGNIIKDIHDNEYWFSECFSLPFEHQDNYVLVRKKNPSSILQWKRAPMGDCVSIGTSLRLVDGCYFLDADGYTISVDELLNKLPKEK